jgi:hypothetical protein
MPTARDINQANDQAGKRVPATMKIIQEASGKAFMPEKCEPRVSSIRADKIRSVVACVCFDKNILESLILKIDLTTIT